MAFDGGEVSGGCAFVSNIVDEVSSHGEASPVCFFLVFFYVAHKSTICGSFVCGY